MEPIKTQIDNDPFSNLAREVEMFQCIFKKDREIELHVDVQHVDENGVAIYKKVNTLNLDPSMVDAFQSMYFPKRRMHTTEGAKINSANGMYSDIGDVSELEFLASLTPAQVQAMFPNENSFLGLIWKFIEARIQTMNTLKKYG